LGFEELHDDQGVVLHDGTPSIQDPLQSYRHMLQRNVRDGGDRLEDPFVPEVEHAGTVDLPEEFNEHHSALPTKELHRRRIPCKYTDISLVSEIHQGRPPDG
jgi:hypothetical protein